MNLRELWPRYASLPDQRALAIAGDLHNNRWVAGASSGHASRSEARAEALEQCRSRRAEQRMQDSCVVYAIGDEVVWRGY